MERKAGSVMVFRWWKRAVQCWSLLAVLFALVACGQGGAPAKSPADAPGGGQSTPAKGPVAYPLTVRDDSGETVTIPKEPARIVSLIPSHTETLFALGLEGRVVAVTSYDHYPPDVQKKVEAVLDGLNPSVEKLAALRPDLVVLGSHNRETVQAIRRAGLTAVMYDPQSLDAVYRTIEQLGEITNRTDRAAALVEQMKAKARVLADKVAAVPPERRPRVYVEVDPDQLFTPGRNTFMDELIRLAGGVNIASDLEGWKPINAEKVIRSNPQVIVLTYGYYVPDAEAKLKQRRGWDAVDAVKTGRVYVVDSDLVNRPGPRVVDAVEALAKLFHPDLFR